MVNGKPYGWRRLKGVALCREDAFDEDGGVVGGGPIVVGGGGVGDGVAAVVVGENVVERCVAVRRGRQSFREGLCLSMEIFFIILLIILTVYYRTLALGIPTSGGPRRWVLALPVWLNGTVIVRRG